MTKNKQILIIGYGSIGKRHLKNLVHLGQTHLSIVRRQGGSIEDFPLVKVYETIEKAYLMHNFDTVIIATPTAVHYKNFMDISKHGIANVYIEKPITNNLEEAIEIETIAKQNNINVSVGFDLHFDLGLKKISDLLKEKLIGNVCSFQVEVGQYLPDWRPNEDYRKGMSAKKELGGGVMLDLIHEFDYVNWIFGPIDNIFGKHTHISHLDIETEDISINIVKTKEGVFGTIYLDYLQKELSRVCKIVGTQGTIIWNYKETTVKWMTHNNPIWKQFDYKHVNRNDRFIAILEAFLKSTINFRDKKLSTISDAIQSLKIVECAKKSNKSNKLVNI